MLVLRDLLRPEVVVSALAHVGAGLVLARCGPYNIYLLIKYVLHSSKFEKLSNSIRDHTFAWLLRSYLGLVGHHKYSGLTLLCAELGQVWPLTPFFQFAFCKKSNLCI